MSSDALKTCTNGRIELAVRIGNHRQQVQGILFFNVPSNLGRMRSGVAEESKDTLQQCCEADLLHPLRLCDDPIQRQEGILHAE